MCTRPKMSHSDGQLNNNLHTVFTHLGLHFLTGGTESVKIIQSWAGNQTKFHLQFMQQPCWLKSAREMYYCTDRMKRTRLIWYICQKLETKCSWNSSCKSYKLVFMFAVCPKIPSSTFLNGMTSCTV